MNKEIGNIENVIYSVLFALVYVSVLIFMVLIVWPFEFVIFWMADVQRRKGLR